MEYLKKYSESITRSEYLLLVNYRDWILKTILEEKLANNLTK